MASLSTFGILLCVIGLSVAARCPSGWMENYERCYQFVTTPASWRTAQGVCSDLGGQMVTIDNAQKSTFITGHAYMTKELRGLHFWIGAYREGSQWRWISDLAASETVKYKNWNIGEPNNNRFFRVDEECVELRPEHHWQWNDASCSHPKPYICEKEAENADAIIG